MSKSDSPEEYFKHCFVEPLKCLRDIPDGKGAMIALASAIFLFERYWSVLPESEREKTKKIQLAKNFNADQAVADAFWKVFRDGLLHLGSPMQQAEGKALTPYSMEPDAQHPFFWKDVSGKKTLIVNPWSFCDRVLALWKEKFHLLDNNKSAPIPQRYPNPSEIGHCTAHPGPAGYRTVSE